MSIPVSCPACGSKLQAPDRAAGRQAKCPKCGKPVSVPATNHAPPVPAGAEPWWKEEAPPRQPTPSAHTLTCRHCQGQVAFDIFSAGRMVACHHCGKQLQVIPPPSGASPQFGTVTAVPAVLEPVGALLWQNPNGGDDDLPGRRSKGKKTARVSGLVLGLSIGGGALALIGVIVLAAVLMGDSNHHSEGETSNKPTNADPKEKLRKVYRAYKAACSKLGHSPDVDQLPTYLREHGDPKAIMQGIGIGEQLFDPKPNYRDVVMAWEQNGKNDKYHVLFYSGRIALLTSDELGDRGIAVGKVAEQIAKDEESRRKADEKERQKAEEEAAKRLEERREERDRVEADRDYVRLRNALPFVPEAERFQSGGNDWITRRAAVITEARKKGAITVKENFGNDEYVGNVPLPSVEDVLDAIRRGKPAPVVSGEKAQQKGKDSEQDQRRQQEKPEAQKKTPETEETKGKPNIPRGSASTKPAISKKQTTPKARLDPRAALRTRVSLRSPYPRSYRGAPSDRISVQYAVIDILKQAGLSYDFRQSQANVGELARRWVTPAITDLPCDAALRRILAPLGMTYAFNNGKLVLRRK
jgi:hypothetical protein